MHRNDKLRRIMIFIKKLKKTASYCIQLTQRIIILQVENCTTKKPKNDEKE